MIKIIEDKDNNRWVLTELDDQGCPIKALFGKKVEGKSLNGETDYSWIEFDEPIPIPTHEMNYAKMRDLKNATLLYLEMCKGILK